MFEVKRSTAKGLIHFQLMDDMPLMGQYQLCSLMDNLLNCPPPPRTTVSSFKTSEFGAEQVDEINLGSYVEPMEGFIIKFFSIPENVSEAAKILKAATGISAAGCKKIVCGNFKCPILTEEVKDLLLEEFAKHNVFCRAEPAIWAEEFGNLDDTDPVITIEDVGSNEDRASDEGAPSQEAQG